MWVESFVSLFATAEESTPDIFCASRLRTSLQLLRKRGGRGRGGRGRERERVGKGRGGGLKGDPSRSKEEEERKKGGRGGVRGGVGGREGRLIERFSKLVQVSRPFYFEMIV